MATFSFGTVPGAPGTYINERVGNVANAAIASFSTTYMLVEAEDDVPVTRFPFNKAIPVSSLTDYRTLVGGIPEARIPLLSYNCVNSFFLNAQVGDLRVVRVGTPDEIAEIEIFPSGTKISSSGLPSALQAGETVYAQITLNGLKLVTGDGSTGYTSGGEWLGVPVLIPVDYIPGDEVNNRKISAAIVTAIATAIETNPSVSSAIYVRDFGLVNDLDPTSNSENGFINLANTTYNGNISVVTLQNPVGGEYVLMQNTYDVNNIVGQGSNLQRVPQDYIQCIETAFDGQNDQGYLITPTAYAQFGALGRATIGAAAASHCQNNNFKWMALADAGPFLVTDINQYENYVPHQASEDLLTDHHYLVDNAIYKWIGDSVTYDRMRFQALIPGYDPEVAVKLSTTQVADGEKIGILDLAKYTVNSLSGFADYGVFKLDNTVVWPAEYQIQKVTLNDAGGDFSSIAPGEVYFIAPAYNPLLYGPYPSDGTEQYVFIAETASEAVSVLTEVNALGGTEAVITAMATPADCFSVGSPTGSTAEATYETPQWNLPVEINGQTSNLVQNITDSAAYVNTLHLPGTLQDPTEDYRLSFVSRTIFDANAEISDDGNGNAAFACVSHNLVSGQKLFFTRPVTTNTGTKTIVKATSKTSIQAYYVKVVDNNTFLVSTSYANYLSGAFVPFPSAAIDVAPTIFYTALSGGGTTAINLSELTTVPFIRGRKYGFATGTIADEAADSTSFSPSATNPTVSIYLNSSSNILGKERIFPYGETTNADWLNKLALQSPGSTTTTTDNFLCTPTVAQSFATQAFMVPTIDAIPGGDYEANTTAAGGSLTSASLYSTSSGLTVGDTGVDIQTILSSLVGVYFDVVVASPPVVGTLVAPDGTTEVQIGDRIAVVQTGSTYSWVVVPDPALGGDLTTVGQVCYGSQVEMAFTQEQTPPRDLWRFDAITSTEIIDQALRGVGFSGDPQAEFVEAGVDNVNRLYEDSQRYHNAFGFIAFYGPYVLNASSVPIPPSPYVTGVALRRYRSEGFQFPPAGTKYQLSDAIGVQIAVNSAQQNLLNPDGCNVLRALPGYPATAIYIWGGRTRINNAVADERKFQFVNTRVIQNVVYGSLRNAFDAQIFSIIDGFGIVYNQIVSIGNSVMNQLYNTGALFGAKPSDAYQVICDDRINTPENLENGIINVKVFDVPVTTLERIQIDLIRVSIGKMGEELASQGL